MSNKKIHSDAATTAGTVEWMVGQLLSWDHVPEELLDEIRAYLLTPGDEEIKEWALRRTMTATLRGRGRADEMPDHSHEIWSRLMRTLGWSAGGHGSASGGHGSDDAEHGSTGGGQRPSLWRNMGLRIAAVLIPAALIIGVWTMWRGGMFESGGLVQTTLVAEGFAPTHIVAPADSVQHITMADGTRVTLNRGSQLEYNDQRAARLSGEAWFEVEKREGEPFVVHSDNGRVRVLGTEFNMNTRAAGEATVVSLYKGVVQVEHSRGESMLAAGGREIAIENAANRRGKHRFEVRDFDASQLPPWVEADRADQLEKAERAERAHNQVLMQILPLGEIFDIVSQEYGVEIVGKESVDLARTYNFILNPDSSLGGVMAALSYANGEFNYTISGKTVTLRKSNRP